MAAKVPIASVILAAGQGTRMKSSLPKVMHRLGDVPLVAYPVELALSVGAAPVVLVTGFGREMVEGYLVERYGDHLVFAEQKEQLGTAHAVAQARSALDGFDGAVLILYGDVPLVPVEAIRTLRRLYSRKGGAPLALATTSVADPPAYGRILRDGRGRVSGIREAKDCTPEELAITEVNPGLYLVDSGFLFDNLERIGQSNAQEEFYLTDLVGLAAREGVVRSVPVAFDDVMGINDRADLARVDSIRLDRLRTALMRSGVTMLAPETVWIGARVKVGMDSVIGPSVVLRGETRVGRGCLVEAGAVLTDATLGAGCRVGAHAVLTDTKLKTGAEVAPGAVV
jgi:bifunctional UDP-N-acetylglucosamine pyrophosphorylase/glucosamine-1-phosphate N-acetyltransferase